MTDDHLISEDETRRIAEAFLAGASWLGKPAWGKTGTGLLGAWHAPGWYPEDEERDFGGQEGSWSWAVKTVDPSGKQQVLSHEKVLEGVRGLVFGEAENPLDQLAIRKLKQWFTEPATERQKLTLDDALSSRVCQQALFGRKVFPVGDEVPWSDKKPNWFEDQRPSAEDGS